MRLGAKAWLAGAILAAIALGGCQTAPAQGQAAGGDPYCGMLPPAMARTQAYAGFSACRLRRAGERPLWQGPLEAGVRQQVRLTFTDGRFRYSRVVTFRERVAGDGVIDVATLTPGPRGRVRVERSRPVAVTVEAVAQLNALADASGVWSFEDGSWDGDEIYLHCQTLDMERLDAAGYRFSSVNIGCNRPRVLMPFLEHLTALAGVPDRNGLY